MAKVTDALKAAHRVYRKVRYKGMAKNQGQLFSLFGLANLA